MQQAMQGKYFTFLHLQEGGGDGVTKYNGMLSIYKLWRHFKKNRICIGHKTVGGC